MFSRKQLENLLEDTGVVFRKEKILVKNLEESITDPSLTSLLLLMSLVKIGVAVITLFWFLQQY